MNVLFIYERNYNEIINDVNYVGKSVFGTQRGTKRVPPSEGKQTQSLINKNT